MIDTRFGMALTFADYNLDEEARFLPDRHVFNHRPRRLEQLGIGRKQFQQHQPEAAVDGIR